MKIKENTPQSRFRRCREPHGGPFGLAEGRFSNKTTSKDREAGAADPGPGSAGQPEQVAGSLLGGGVSLPPPSPTLLEGARRPDAETVAARTAPRGIRSRRRGPLFIR